MPAAGGGTVLFSALLVIGVTTMIPAASAEKVTFFVSPDTHFTQCAGFEDAESSSQNVDVVKNLRGIHDMATVPGQAFPKRSQYGGAVESHVRGVIVPGDLIDNGCSPPAHRTPGPFSTFIKVQNQGHSGSGTYTHSTEHLDSSDAPAGETGGTRRCLSAERGAAELGSGVCGGNVSACATECSANISCAAFTMECEADTAGQRACVYVSTVNRSSSDVFRCVFKTSVHVTPTPNFTIPGCADQWANYTAAFGLLPGEGKVTLPVFEGLGNHDGGPKGGLPPNSSTPWLSASASAAGQATAQRSASLQHDPNHIWKGVIARNRRRVKAAASIGVNNYRLSANGLHYSWDWGRVHLAMLNLYPGNQGKGSQGSALNSPSYSLQFLVEDLKRVDPSAPVILFFHYPLRGSMAFPHYWTEAEALVFGRAIKDHNVVALVHGHTHSCVFYRWDLSNVTGRVYNVFNAPALQKGGATDPLSTPSQYLVFEIDDELRRLRVFQRVGNGWGTVMHESVYNATLVPRASRSHAYNQGAKTEWRTVVVSQERGQDVRGWVP